MSIRRELRGVLTIIGLIAAIFAAPALPDSGAPSTSGIMDALLKQIRHWQHAGLLFRPRVAGTAPA